MELVFVAAGTCRSDRKPVDQEGFEAPQRELFGVQDKLVRESVVVDMNISGSCAGRTFSFPEQQQPKIGSGSAFPVY